MNLLELVMELDRTRLLGDEKYGFIYSTIRCLIGYAISHNYAKIKVD